MVTKTLTLVRWYLCVFLRQRGRPAATSQMRLQSGLARNALSRPQSKTAAGSRSTLLKSRYQPFRNEQKRFAMTTGNLSMATMKESMKTDPVAWWLFGCAGMIATTLTVGAAASLTRSGASMLYWKPHGLLPPKSESEWHKEFETYREFCHFHQHKEMVKYCS